MKNTIDLTDGRVFRDKFRPKMNGSNLWKNYGEESSAMLGDSPFIKGTLFELANDSYIVSSTSRYNNTFNVDLSYYNYTSPPTANYSSVSYTLSTNASNNVYDLDMFDMVNDDNDLYVSLKDIENSRLNYDKNTVLDAIHATRTIEEYFAKRRNCDKLLYRGERTFSGFSSLFSFLYAKNLRTIDFEDDAMDSYPFYKPSYEKDEDNPFRRKMVAGKSLRSLWNNYKKGEKNPLNSWNLDPDFLDEEIVMPTDEHFMDRHGYLDRVIQGIN